MSLTNQPQVSKCIQYSAIENYSRLPIDSWLGVAISTIATISSIKWKIWLFSANAYFLYIRTTLPLIAFQVSVSLCVCSTRRNGQLVKYFFSYMLAKLLPRYSRSVKPGLPSTNFQLDATHSVIICYRVWIDAHSKLLVRL